jgi:hypothetical protein
MIRISPVICCTVLSLMLSPDTADLGKPAISNTHAINLLVAPPTECQHVSSTGIACQAHVKDIFCGVAVTL